MSADGSRVSPDTETPNRGQISPLKRMALRTATAAPAFLVALALASIAGFVTVAGQVLIYDANVYGSGALAGFSRASTGLLTQALLVLGLLVFVLATGRLGVRGALVALLGFAIIGPWLAVASPLHDEPSVRTVCCDGVRSFIFISGTLVGIFCFVIVVPIILVVRWISRHRRHPA